jgi:hypothetical protein
LSFAIILVHWFQIIVDFVRCDENYKLLKRTIFFVEDQVLFSKLAISSPQIKLLMSNCDLKISIGWTSYCDALFTKKIRTL